MTDDPRRTTDTRLYAGAIEQLMDAVREAHVKHGRTFERGNMDRKLRIMVEEVGEIADAIEEIEVARTRVDIAEHEYAANPQSYVAASELQESEELLRAAVEHLHVEVAQVGACCLRWLTGEP